MDLFSRYDLFGWLYHGMQLKNGILLAAFWDKLHLGAWCVVMYHAALSTMPLLASYVITMALFNEREKLSKSVGKIEILPSIS